MPRLDFCSRSPSPPQTHQSVPEAGLIPEIDLVSHTCAALTCNEHTQHLHSSTSPRETPSMQRQIDGINRIPSPWIRISTALRPSPVDEGLDHGSDLC